MLLLLAIVQSEDAPDLAKQLMDEGLRLTQINSSGGLFAAGSVALLLGIEEVQYDTVIKAMVATCRTRTKHISAVAMPEPTFFYFMPVEVEVGGAIVFTVPVERFAPVPRSSVSEDATSISDTAVRDMDMDEHGMKDGVTGVEDAPQVELSIDGQSMGESKRMKLIVAIVQAEDADAVIRALLAAEHRLTRINTTGGFLRRGNATLLIGVQSGQVDEVINLIQSASRRRTESTPIEQGIPEYAATVFVLDASHFVRI
jgi:uncharacterized protein YaaQ